MLLLVLLHNHANAESDLFNLGILRLTRLNGSVALTGSYFYKTYEMKDGFKDYQNAYLLMGDLKLSTGSYLWHPNFFELGLDLQYSPSANKENYIIIPDRSETVNAERISLSAVIMKVFPVSFGFNTDYNHSYISRDKLSDIENKSNSIGANINYRNSFLPMNISYNKSNSKQNEITDKWYYIYSNEAVRGTATFRPAEFTENDFNASFENINTHYSGTDNLNTKMLLLNANNTLYFDKFRDYNLNSRLMYMNVQNYQRNSRLDENINFSALLPYDFRYNAGFNYSNNTVDTITSQMINQVHRLEHQLFLSLHSYTYFQSYNNKSSQYDDGRYTGALGFNYKKITALNGMLYINSEFRLDKQYKTSQPQKVLYRDEEYRLNDGKIILIRNPYIDILSLVIRNKEGSLIYREKLDYEIIAHGNFLEIRRMPGGMIENGAKVYVDYVSTMSAAYDYNIYSYSLSANWVIFKDLLDIYTDFQFNEFSNNYENSPLILNTLNQKTYGLRSTYGPTSAGIEFQNINNTILPYNSSRYYIRFNDYLLNSFNLILDANYQNYTYTETESQQSTTEISASVDYPLTSQSAITTTGSLSSISSFGYDMSVVNLKAEYKLNFYNIYLTAGIDAFFRRLNKEKTDYTRLLIRIERRF